MPLWSLTVERLERLKAQIAAKKAEHDELEALTEKDLWCRDLDAFSEEWDAQLKIDAEIQTTIRRMGRRVSKKIGAGKGRRVRDDDDYQPDKKAGKGKAAKVTKVEAKTHQRFAEMFSGKPKANPKTDAMTVDGAADESSDDDFAMLGKIKPSQVSVSEAEPNGRTKRAAASKSKAYLDDDSDESDFDFGGGIEKAEPASQKSSEPELPAPEPMDEDVEEVRNKRPAASKAKTWIVDEAESDSDDDKMLGDVGALVKGIGAPAANGNRNRLSLFAMSRPESGSAANGTASAAVSKLKSKPSRTFDFDSHDDTNYEALALSSPRKSTKGDDLADFLSDDDFPVVSKTTSVAKTASSAAVPKPKPAKVSVVSAPVAKGARGRPAGTKNKPKEDAAPKAKPVHLSPAAKAYAAKKAKATKLFSDDEDDEDDDAPPAKSAPARGRPGRAAAVKAKPIVLDDDSDDDASDAFAMDDSD
jgi:DNA topoisomerase-2